MEELRLSWNGQVLRVDASSEITHELVPQMKSLIENELAGRECAGIVLNLSRVDFLDSSGISFLLACNTRMGSQGKLFCLLSPSQAVRRTLGIVQLLSFFKTAEDETGLAELVSAAK